MKGSQISTVPKKVLLLSATIFHFSHNALVLYSQIYAYRRPTNCLKRKRMFNLHNGNYIYIYTFVYIFI